MTEDAIYLTLIDFLRLLKDESALDLSWSQLHRLQSVLRNCDRRILEIAHQKAAESDERLSRISEMLLSGRGGESKREQPEPGRAEEARAAGGEQSEQQPQPQGEGAAGRSAPAHLFQCTDGKLRDLSAFYVPAGPLRGIHKARKVCCRQCGRRIRAAEAANEGWPEATLCAACAQPEPSPAPDPVRSGPSPSNPWEGVPADAAVLCESCKAPGVAEFVRQEWPLPDLCDRCAAATEPDPPPDAFVPLVEHRGNRLIAVPEDVLDHFKAEARKGRTVVGDPVLSFRPEGVTHEGYLLQSHASPPPRLETEAVLRVTAKVPTFKEQKARMNTAAGKRERRHQGLRSRNF